MSQGEVMDARPMTDVEKERERAMVIAQEIATGLDDPNVTGPQFLTFMKSCVTTDDISFMAEALLASAGAAQAMREALEGVNCWSGWRYAPKHLQESVTAAIKKATKP